MSLRQRQYGELAEAGDVKFKELEPENKKKVRAIQKATGAKPFHYQSGIGGDIAGFRSVGNRFNAEALKKFASSKVRWLEVYPQDKMFYVGL